MAWNWIINLANYCKVYVITEGEWREQIEREIKKLPQSANIVLYYSPVSQKIRQMCWNQGDWRFYYFYRKWQLKALQIARRVVLEHKIDIVHQLNMIGFREPGYLWKIKGVPFIWGPIGGMENVPLGYLGGLSAKAKFTVVLKNLINSYQARYSLRVRSAIRESSALIAAVKGVKDKIQEFHGKQVILINETGCYPCDSTTKEINKDGGFNIIWVGKFDYRKQLSLALLSIQKVRNLRGLKFHIVGDGNAGDRKAYRELAESLDIRELCVWHGLIPRESVQELMKKSDLLLFTSIMEGTPHVVLEAIANNLPVLCFDACGQSAAVNESIGIKLNVTSQKQSITDFAEKIEYLYGHSDVLHEMSLACVKRQQELSWDSKAKEMLSIYEMVLSKCH